MPRPEHILALTAALIGAAGTVLVQRGLRGSDPYTGFWINLVVGTVGLWGGVAFTGGIGRVTGMSVVYFVLAGLIGTFAGRLLRYVSIDKVGASVAAALLNLNPMFAALLAIALLGEHVTAPLMAGTVIIVIGTILLSARGQRLDVRPAHIVYPILSAACFGVVTIFRKLGLAQMGPVIGSAINVMTAMIAFTAFLVASGRGWTASCRGRSLAYFIAAGAAENTSVFLNVFALSVGAVSVVAPLYGTAPIFVLFLSFFFLRGIDGLNARVIVGTLLIVAGVGLITALGGR